MLGYFRIIMILLLLLTTRGAYAADGPIDCSGQPSYAHLFNKDGDAYPDLTKGVQWFCRDAAPSGWYYRYLLASFHSVTEEVIMDATIYQDCDDNDHGRAILLRVWPDKDGDSFAVKDPGNGEVKCFGGKVDVVFEGSAALVTPAMDGFTDEDPKSKDSYDCNDNLSGKIAFDLYVDEDEDGYGKSPSLGKLCETKPKTSKEGFDCEDADKNQNYSILFGGPKPQDACPNFRARMEGNSPVVLTHSDLGSSRSFKISSQLNAADTQTQILCRFQCPNWNISSDGTITFPAPNLTLDGSEHDLKEKLLFKPSLWITYQLSDGKFYEVQLNLEFEYTPSEFTFPKDRVFILQAATQPKEKSDIDLNIFDNFKYLGKDKDKIRFSVDCPDCGALSKPEIIDDVLGDSKAQLRWNPVDANPTIDSIKVYGGLRKEKFILRAFIKEGETIAEAKLSYFMGTGVELVSINGINTNSGAAAINAEVLDSFIKPVVDKIGFPAYGYTIVHNPSGGMVADLSESLGQDLEEIYEKTLTENERKGVTLALLAYSNFQNSSYTDWVEASTAIFNPLGRFQEYLKLDDSAGLTDFLDAIDRKFEELTVASLQNPFSSGERSIVLKQNFEKVSNLFLQMGKKILLVSHSQGNWFSNEMYDELKKTIAEKITNPDKALPKYVNQVQIAPPTTSAADGGNYAILNPRDVIRKVSPLRAPNVFVPDDCDPQLTFNFLFKKKPTTVSIYHSLTDCYLNQKNLMPDTDGSGLFHSRSKVVDYTKNAFQDLSR